MVNSTKKVKTKRMSHIMTTQLEEVLTTQIYMITSHYKTLQVRTRVELK